MFYDNIDERKDLIVSKLEYSKKKRYLENDESYEEKIKIINKIINNEATKVDLEGYISQLEYTFKKKYKETLENTNIESIDPTKLNTKTDKAIYILLHI